MFLKEIDIRWSDMDANRHLANKTYIEYAAHARMGFLSSQGITPLVLAKYNFGPIAFSESIYFFKEVFVGKPIKVSLELSAASRDWMFFEFTQNFYDYKGKNFAHYQMMGSWIDLKTRKLTALPEELKPLAEKIERSSNFRVLTKEDTRKHGKKPIDLTT